MTKKEQQDLEKKALDQLLSGESLFGKEGAFAPMLKRVYRESTSSRDEFSFKHLRK